MMNKILVFFMMITGPAAFGMLAATASQVDSLPQHTPEYPQEWVAQQQANPKFQYQESPPVDDNFLTQILDYIGEKFYDLFSNEQRRNAILYITFFLALVFVLFHVYKLRPAGLFRSGARRTAAGAEYGSGKEYRQGLEKALRHFEGKHDWKNALRSLLLLWVDELSAQGRIHADGYKSPTELAAELQDEKLSPPFENLARHYQYVWYGGFLPDPQRYQNIRRTSQELGIIRKNTDQTPRL